MSSKNTLMTILVMTLGVSRGFPIAYMTYGFDAFALGLRVVDSLPHRNWFAGDQSLDRHR